MAFIYPHDPESVQEQLRGALRALDAWQRTTSGLQLALFGLRSALDACPSDEVRAALQAHSLPLQEQHQQALFTARACAEAVQELTRKLAPVADANLDGSWRRDLEEAA